MFIKLNNLLLKLKLNFKFKYNKLKISKKINYMLTNKAKLIYTKYYLVNSILLIYLSSEEK